MGESREMLARCTCGVLVTGSGEDDLVANVEKHVLEAHPGVSVTREQVLAMAEMVPGTWRQDDEPE